MRSLTMDFGEVRPLTLEYVGGIRELSSDEIELVSGAIDWGAVGDAALIGGYSGMAGGIAAGATGALLTGGALAPAIGVGAIAGGVGGLVTGATASILAQTLFSE